ncbi:MAG: [acyl-carrier-protein] S-malonyltransferase, partial [Verrucomicrobia bacterium]|nr:[acyl-carrier-protein] S-malonyltransferase [Verrucomicrobiota bacterium]
MSNQVVLLFSGQGAQSVGMGKELADIAGDAGNLLAQADGILGWSLTQAMI